MARTGFDRHESAIKTQPARSKSEAKTLVRSIPGSSRPPEFSICCRDGPCAQHACNTLWCNTRLLLPATCSLCRFTLKPHDLEAASVSFGSSRCWLHRQFVCTVPGLALPLTCLRPATGSVNSRKPSSSWRLSAASARRPRRSARS